MAHIDAGKTTTTERILFYSGKVYRIGEVDEGTASMDWMDQEQERGITITSAATSCYWKDHRVAIIDTPGHVDFTAEVERSLRVLDGAVAVFCAVGGVEPQSETVWHQADRYRLPRFAFINKLDRIGATFPRVLREINDKFGNCAAAVQIPVGIESAFSGIIDLVTREYLTFEGDAGEQVVRQPIPAEHQAAADTARLELIERLADHSDDIALRFLEGEDVPADLLQSELRRLVRDCRIVPVFAGSAKRNIGVQPLLDAVLAWFPSPEDIPDIPAMSAKDHEPATIHPDSDAPFVGFVFKLVASTTADLYYMRTYAGTLKIGDSVYLPRTNSMVRVKRLLRLYAKQVEPIDQVGPGDIVGLIGPKDIVTGDTLCVRHKAVIFEKMTFPEPVISMALEPRSTKDKDRLDEALTLLTREDPTLSLSRDENTGQRLLSGMGELHLEVLTHRLSREHKLDVNVGRPQVVYRETVTSEAEVSESFDREIAGSRARASLTLRLGPAERGAGESFEAEPGAAAGIPPEMLAAVRESALESLGAGAVLGYPTVDVAVRLTEASSPDQTPNDLAFRAVAGMAVRRALEAASPALLEPVMDVEVIVPDEFMGEVIGDLNSRGGRVEEVQARGSARIIKVFLPLSKMFGYATDLRSASQGRGTFSMQFSHYDFKN